MQSPLQTQVWINMGSLKLQSHYRLFTRFTELKYIFTKHDLASKLAHKHSYTSTQIQQKIF